MTEKYMDFALRMAHLSGEIMKSNFGHGMKKEWKADNTPLTEADLKINQLILDSVKSHFPEHSVLAEEGNALVDKSEYTWVCDPIDGTIPFSHSIPTCAFSLALVKNGQSILGVIYDPFLDRMYRAELGSGAWLNDQEIHVSEATSVKNTVVSVIPLRRFPYHLLHVLDTLERENAKMIDLKSIVYMDSLVASGEMTATIFPSTQSHDSAAAKVIVEEAGGRVTDFFGQEQRYDREIRGVIVSNGHVHDHLVELIGKYNQGLE